MGGMDEIRATFFVECGELMEQLEAGLLDLEAGRSDGDTVDAIFRAVHSIKGGAAAFDLSALVGFAHEFETALDALRTGALDATGDVVAVLLRASDRLGDLVTAARDGVSADASIPEELSALAALAAEEEAGDDPFGLGDMGGGFAAVPVAIDLDDDIAGDTPDAAPLPVAVDAGPRRWRISFEPLPDFFASGNEPLFLFRALAVLGRLEPCLIDAAIPTLSALDPTKAVVRWEILLTPNAGDLTETEIESVFEFVHDLCVLSIDPAPELDPPPQGESDAATDSVGDALQAPPAAAFDAPGRQSTSDPANAVGAPSTPMVPSQTVRPAPPKPAAATIRVDLERVDRLVNLVGELVISQSMVAQSINREGGDGGAEATACLDALQQLTREMQESVMAIRAQPVQPLFQRMARIVREAAQATGKKVRLDTEGETTEIDKTVVEALADPLTHMIRNSVDHGLEDEAGRLDAGKDGTGVVRLAARQQSDRVFIDVSDDGRGIDRDRVFARAVEKGLVAPDRQLSAEEIDRLLFAPGFSTAESVSALSGRGVGMDVVQRAIGDLDGAITIASTPGRGTTMSISLPLTLAILDGMIVRTGSQRMIIPLSAIVETQTAEGARVERVGDGREVVRLHDRFVPFMDLAEVMGFRDRPDPVDEDDASFVFLKAEEHPVYALRVGGIEAQRQVVVKGLGNAFGKVRCVSAATILGDGQVALIVDPKGVADEARDRAGTADLWDAA